MPLASERASAAIRYWRSKTRLLLLGITMENIVFRHEIGMDPFGRLRPGSPIYWAHGVMAAWLALEALLLAVWGWKPVVVGLATVMGAITLGMYPFALHRAFRNLVDERTSCSLEQLWLTPIGSGDLFEGKYYGLLAPLIEIRKYLMLAGLLFCFGILVLAPGPWFLLALVVWLTGINHIGHSAVTGTLAGLRWGLLSEARLSQILRDWRLNPWPSHLWLNLQIGAMLALPLAFLFWLGMKARVTLFPAFGLMMLMPFYVALHLTARHEQEIAHFGTMFRALMNFEGPGLPRPEVPEADEGATPEDDSDSVQS